MSDVYISYARRDKSFVQKLHATLSAKGRDVWIDWEDIPPSADWQQEMRDGISQAGAVVFVMSPDFLASQSCRLELEWAIEFNKRLIPLVYRDFDVGSGQVPPALASHNWIFMRAEDDFEAGLRALEGSIDTDLEWVKAHTRLLVRAAEWERAGRNHDYLLRGRELEQAKQFLEQTGKKPQVTELQAQYIMVSLSQRWSLVGIVGVIAKPLNAFVLSIVNRIKTGWFWLVAQPSRLATLLPWRRVKQRAVPQKGVIFGTTSNWSDREILKPDQDHFNFQDYASVLATRAVNSDTPLIVGVFGQWGSGKTSLMRLIDAALQKQTIQGGQVRTIWVNVWQLSNQNETWHAFLQALFGKIHSELSLWQRIDKRELFRQLFSNSYRIIIVITPMIVGILLSVSEATWDDVWQLALNPANTSVNPSSLLLNPAAGAGTLITIGLSLWTLAKPVVEAARKTVSFDLQEILHTASYQTQVTELMQLQQRFEEMVKLLVGEHGRLIVFIDDLDRCQPAKVPEILEAIKLFATMSGCVYFLGLDRDIVTQAIEVKYGFKANTQAATDYLEKIIQIPFHLPPLDQNKIRDFIKTYYPELNPDTSLEYEIFAKGLEANPRHIKRVLNIYRTVLDLAQVRVRAWEMDLVEPELVAKMIIIQNRFPALYKQSIEQPALLQRIEQGSQSKKPLSFDEVQSLLDKENVEIATQATDRDLLALLASGKSSLGDNVSALIHLTGATDGTIIGERPNREEQEILLGGDPDALWEKVQEILRRGQGDQKQIKAIKELYIKRLNKVIEANSNYDGQERISANMVLDLFEEQKWENFEPQTVRVIADGSFLMGSASNDLQAGNDEKPQFEMRISPFRIAVRPVTQQQYQAFVKDTGASPKHLQNLDIDKEAEKPASNVSWHDAVAYCQWLSEATRRTYRLPSEAEWEMAARGTDGRIYPWGNEAKRPDVDPNSKNIPHYAAYGALEFTDGVREWTRSLYQDYPYQPKDGRENMESEDPRVLRGGAFAENNRLVRCAYRLPSDPQVSSRDIGFRVVLEMDNLNY